MSAPIPPGAPRPGNPPPGSPFQNYNPNLQRAPDSSLPQNFQNLNINQPPNSAAPPSSLGPGPARPPFVGQASPFQASGPPSTFPGPSPISRPGPPPPGVYPRSAAPQQIPSAQPPNLFPGRPSSAPLASQQPPSFASRPVSGPPQGSFPMGGPPMGPPAGPTFGGPPSSAQPSGFGSPPYSASPVVPRPNINGPSGNLQGARFPSPGGYQQPMSGPPPGSIPMRAPTMRSVLGGEGIAPPGTPPQPSSPFSIASQGFPPSGGPSFGTQPWQTQQNQASLAFPGSAAHPGTSGMMPNQPMGQAGPMGGSSKIDPNQIPRPIPSSSVLIHETRQNNQANPPPPATTEFIARDTGNCSPRYMRCTVNQIPCTKDLLATSGMQLALLVQPLALPHPSEEPIQVKPEPDLPDPIARSRNLQSQSAPEEGRGEKEECEKKEKVDPELFTCLLQPLTSDSDSDYVGVRRLLLHRKAAAGLDQRKDWRCNGKGYVAFRNFINKPLNWESLYSRSLTNSTPNQSERWMSSPAQLSLFLEVDSLGSSRELSRSNQARASFGSSASGSERFDRYHKQVEPAYSFVGMHCIFDQCKVSVTVVKFGHMSSDLLAYGTTDGSITVCSVAETPKVLNLLTGHSRDVTDFDFTSNNQYIASSSMDKTVRVWDISKGVCIRVIYGVSSQWCIRFHPVNNNFLSVGNANKEINVYNFSTGRMINKTVLDDEVTAMDYDQTGRLIFCGDARGSIHTLKTDPRTGALSRSHRNKNGSKKKSPVTVVQYRSFSLLARGPVLLTCTQDGSLSFFSVALEIHGYLTLRCSLKLTPRLHRIRASFCPLLSLEKGEYIVAGSEDSNVYFYDLTRPRHTCVNKLQGHGSSVIGIAWNHGENYLASSDSDGTVIVWKRAKVR